MPSALARKLKNAMSRITPWPEVPCDPESWRYRRLERRVGNVHLPNLMVMRDGTPVDSSAMWNDRRRPELLELFRTHEYGRTPSTVGAGLWSVLTTDDGALGGVATRKEIRIDLTPDKDGPALDLLVYLPNRLRQRGIPVPLFVGLNFFGNHTVHEDGAIAIPRRWIPTNSMTKGRPAGMLRGLQSSCWPVGLILDRGYGLATAYCGDIVPDRADGLNLGIHRWFRERALGISAPDSWGAIGGWAWGLSRAMDYLRQDIDINSTKIALIGHSRLGKVALWAGAQDERFAMVISNNSGCGGAALAMRKFGERLAEINSVNPHWFCDNFKQFNDREETLPIDQHELLGLIAPRPVYVGSAQLDLAADPMGEFLCAKYASCVYQLLGSTGLPNHTLPAVGTSIYGGIGYHIRKGRHGITFEDWTHYLAFADFHFTQRAPPIC
jgi:hypothetical protein